MRRTLLVGAFVAATALTAAMCGGGSSPTSPSTSTPAPAPAPSPTPSPTPAPAPSGGTTITITSSGVSPRTLTVAAGTRVTFINSDTRTHEMDSDPHPEHTDCTEINQVSFMTPGQTKLTGNLTRVRTCSYHDHERPDTANLQGAIIITN